jgi:hypothetical protein
VIGEEELDAQRRSEQPSEARAVAPPPRRQRRRRRRRVVVVAVVILALLAVLSEILLPSIAENRLRDSLAAHGDGVHVHIEAEPAIKLLVGDADRVSVRIAILRSGRGNLGDRIASTQHTDRLDATVGTLITHGLALDHVWLRKRGNLLTAGAGITPRALRAALPSGVRVNERGAGANRLAFTATAHVLGHVLRATAFAEARDGRLLLEPAGPVARFVHFTVFGDPRVSVDSITSHRLRSGRYVFTARAHLK